MKKISNQGKRFVTSTIKNVCFQSEISAFEYLKVRKWAVWSDLVSQCAVFFFDVRYQRKTIQP